MRDEIVQFLKQMFATILTQTLWSGRVFRFAPVILSFKCKLTIVSFTQDCFTDLVEQFLGRVV